ncbi:unnamed protein product [Heligmosomoides polygyrus]|uniref:Diacylglycerol kinase n=1 Tax=Heligmosomoides polygyrus TaxID=6339 RepID=A0A183FK46_HELPZ|nr:unnamed protein product [Heligmosomoides polygyrus]
MDLYEELAVASIFVLVSIIVLYVFRKLLEDRKRKSINDSISAKSGHYWTRVDFVDRGFFCGSCKTHLLSGYECDYCTLKVDEVACARSIADKITCKTVQKPDNDGNFKHHWIPGNIDSDQFCFVCDELCGGGVSLRDHSCCLCWRVVHSSCMKKLSSSICDFGPYRSFTFPPDSVITRKTAKKLVIDVQKENVKSALQWIDDHPEVDVRLVVAGGDGTISNILETLEQFQRRPPMAVLPLGTGNDLSRVLGWGSGTNGDLDILEYLNDVHAAEVQKLDRWKVMIKSKNQVLHFHSPRRFPSRTENRYRSMRAVPHVEHWNYKSLCFRLLNKLLFFSFGTKDVFTRTCKGLRDNISLYLDDKLIELPGIEGIVFLNIQCWGAGVQPWKYADEEYPQKIDDGVFEVFAVTSSFHIAQMQVCSVYFGLLPLIRRFLYGT